LADEPTGNLDSETGNGILEILEELNKLGQTIVMVTHDERIAQRAGRIVTLVDGKIKD
jgi:putative ABC transport system ATP-binding protein